MEDSLPMLKQAEGKRQTVEDSNGRTVVISILLLALPALGAGPGTQKPHENPVIDLWMQGKPAFGVFVPNEAAGRRGANAAAARGQTPPVDPAPARPPYSREGGEKLAANPLYDFVFLNLEGRYDATFVRAVAEGLGGPGAAGRKTLVVRIPPIERDGEAATKARVKEAFDLGADGVTIPHVRSVEEARLAIGFFRDAGVSVWSPSNPSGEKLAMLMIEDPGALAVAAAIADLPGYSILACGIGSLRSALGGDAAGAEAGTQKVLAESKRARLVNMLTANAQDIEKRIKEGFLALLLQGASADEAIRIGRAAAGR